MPTPSDSKKTLLLNTYIDHTGCYIVKPSLVSSDSIVQKRDSFCKLCDYVIKWKHFPRYWPFVWGTHRSLVNSPYEGQMMCLNRRPNKQSRRRWFGTPPRSLWCYRNGITNDEMWWNIYTSVECYSVLAVFNNYVWSVTL